MATSRATGGFLYGAFWSSRVTHFIHRRFLGSISPGLILTASSIASQQVSGKIGTFCNTCIYKHFFMYSTNTASRVLAEQFAAA